jgi:hypothetical protein
VAQLAQADESVSFASMEKVAWLHAARLVITRFQMGDSLCGCVAQDGVFIFGLLSPPKGDLGVLQGILLCVTFPPNKY